MQEQDSKVAKEGRRTRNYDPLRGPFTNSASSRSKEALEKASENNQKR